MFRFELCVGGLAWNEGHVRRVDPQKARFAGRMVGGTVNADFFVDRLEAVAHRAISYPVIGRRLMKDLDRRALVGDAGGKQDAWSQYSSRRRISGKTIGDPLQREHRSANDLGTVLLGLDPQRAQQRLSRHPVDESRMIVTFRDSGGAAFPGINEHNASEKAGEVERSRQSGGPAADNQTFAIHRPMRVHDHPATSRILKNRMPNSRPRLTALAAMITTSAFNTP